MDMQFTVAELAFRDELRAFLRSHLSPLLRARSKATPTVFDEPDVAREWQRILHEKGWLAYNWPLEHGGCGWSPVQRYIFEKECALAEAPRLPGFGLKLLAFVLHAFGTPEQQQHYLPRILSGEHYWCQGFSEPQAGSDLASLKTRAVRRGDRYVINGSKLWTTQAHHADHMFCLVRTDPAVASQRGISFMLVDLHQPGVEVRPILGMAGDHEVNAVFLTDAEAPAADLIGQEGQGWTIAKRLLENERGGSCNAPQLLADIAAVRAIASERPLGDGRMLVDDQSFAAEIGRAELEALALETTELRILAEIAEGKNAGPKMSLVKLVTSSLRQNVDSLAMRLWGYAGLQLTRSRPLYAESCPAAILDKAAQIAPARYLNSRAWTIFGGSNEVQRTIIAKTLLGL